jgi:hypothetical protein
MHMQPVILSVHGCVVQCSATACKVALILTQALLDRQLLLHTHVALLEHGSLHIATVARELLPCGIRWPHHLQTLEQRRNILFHS